ncbi:MAG: chemotaxis response regulator protein-glutamate methylesterase [Syntrophorhabdaceae bacterium]|nr:chemotaxis response regulator protein-glutamate methylesterase [Syntrophorhabdaceae bacterium]
MRVLVVDDSALFRRVLADTLSALPDTEVVGWAQNGKIALEKIKELKPDLVTLDLEMPEMNGLAVIDALAGVKDAPAIIVVSALTKKGGQLTLEALSKGAFDFITKPEAADPVKGREQLRTELATRLRAFSARSRVLSRIAGRSAAPALKPEPLSPDSAKVPKSVAVGRITTKPEMLLIGVSTGGPNALGVVLPALPKDLGVPVLVVQHMPPVFTQSLAESLNTKCALKVCEASHGMAVEVGTIYIAPGGRHMRVASGAGGTKVIQITDDPPENNCRPAVDYLFRSAANNFPGKSLGVILTGMGSDGVIGLRLLKRHGCFVIAQDEASCVVYGMPKSAVDAGVVDVVLPLGAIAQRVALEIRMALRSAAT